MLCSIVVATRPGILVVVSIVMTTIYGGCPIFLYLKTLLSPCLSRTFRGLSRPKENPQKLHLTTIKAYMKTHIILPFRRPFRRAFADLSRPQKSTDFASHMFWLYININKGFRTAPICDAYELKSECLVSPLITPIVVSYTTPTYTPFK